MTAGGVNVIEVNSAFGSTTGYFDDISVIAVPEPSGLLLTAGGGVLAAFRFRRRPANTQQQRHL
jgi:hypothetical protein